MRRALLVTVCAAASLPFFVACEKKTDPPPQTAQATATATAYPPNQYPPNQYPPNQYPPNQYPPNQYPPQPTATYTAPPPTATYTAPPPTATATATAPPTATATATTGFPFPLPSGLPTFPPPSGTAPGAGGAAPAGTPAQAIDPNFAGVATFPLNAFAQTEAPGMAREGNLIAGNFQEGQILEQPITLQGGKCYTVLALGVGGISEVDIALIATTQIPQLNGVLQRDTSSGAQASLGGKGNCYKLPFPAPFSTPAKYVVKVSRGAGIAAAALYVK